MGRALKYLVIFGVFCAGGLYGYSFLLNTAPAPVTEIVKIDVE